jgi:methyl-accepting chemotaxis protein
MIAGMSFMVSISVLVATLSGTKIQVDVHMYYFAALAILATMCDWRVIVAATATVAVHHIVLNFAIPDLIYRDGGDIGRLALHAIVLIVESISLVWLCATIVQTLKANALEQKSAEDASRDKLRLQEEASQARRGKDEERVRIEAARIESADQQARVVEAIAAGLEHLADGNLVFRLNDTFAPEYERLRGSFNEAMGKLQDALRMVAANADTMHAGTKEITGAADDLARRTEQQASALEETAAALGEITATV